MSHLGVDGEKNSTQIVITTLVPPSALCQSRSFTGGFLKRPRAPLWLPLAQNLAKIAEIPVRIGGSGEGPPELKQTVVKPQKAAILVWKDEL